MQTVPTYPPPTVIVVPLKVGMAKRARVEIRWTDDGTIATLLQNGHRVSRTRAELDGPNHRPAKFVRRGRDWFLVFLTFCATCEAQNYVLLGKASLAQTGGFENGWAPDFPRTVIVYEYPRHSSMDESHRIGRDVWLQRTWRWSAHRRKFVLASTKDVCTMPPVPYRRFRCG